MNWLTPNVQKGIAFAFVFAWYLANGRFALFWQALSGQATLGQGGAVGSIGGLLTAPDILGGRPPDEPSEPSKPDEPGTEPPPELPSSPKPPELPAPEEPLPLEPGMPITGEFGF